MAEEGGKGRLGRGLAALIGDVRVEPQSNAERPKGQRRIAIAFIRPNPRNPRRSYDDADLADLAQSIREKGVVQPLIVRPLPGADVYEIIAGERRWRAAQRAGLHEVPVIVRDATDKEALELALIENIQRADLNALEEALGYQQLMDEHQYTQVALAETIGKSRSHIANTMRLLKLPDEVKDLVRDGKLSAGHARTLVTSSDPAAAARRIVEAGMSVRDAEAMDSTKGGGRSKAKAATSHKDADTLALEKSLSDRLGLAVTIDHKQSGGEVRVRYTTLEQLDDVCRKLRG
jgi:ParB family chromosome partitioning protein